MAWIISFLHFMALFLISHFTKTKVDNNLSCLTINYVPVKYILFMTAPLFYVALVTTLILHGHVYYLLKRRASNMASITSNPQNATFMATQASANVRKLTLIITGMIAQYGKALYTIFKLSWQLFIVSKCL